MENLVVFESEHFVVKQCSDVSIPGYLIIIPKSKILFLSDFSPDVLHLLTSLIAKVEEVLIEVLKVEMIYIAKFAEFSKVYTFIFFLELKAYLRHIFKIIPPQEIG